MLHANYLQSQDYLKTNWIKSGKQILYKLKKVQNDNSKGYNRNLADIRKNGYLDEIEFSIAMHYIAKLMDKSITTLPSILPPDIYQSVSSPALPSTRAKKIDSIGTMAFSSAPSFSAWDVSADEKTRYDAFFTKLDKQHKGYVAGTEAVEFFKNSKLPDADLAKVWDLADIRQSGTLSKDEFAVAMHLINKRLTGGSLPSVLPQTLVPPSTPVLPPFSPVQKNSFSAPGKKKKVLKKKDKDSHTQ